MARQATGQFYKRKLKGGGWTYGVRVRACGSRHFIQIARSTDGWTESAARQEMENIVADVRRGIWRPPEPEPEPVEQRTELTFHEFASEWYARREAEGLRPRTLEYFMWALRDHLLPFFAGYKLRGIRAEDIDTYAIAKVREGKLSNGSVNKTLEVMSSVMELAVEYGHVSANPAKGRRRRLPTSKPERAFLEPDQVRALLDAAAELDAADRRGRRHRRALLATLAFAGLRIGELLALRWQDVDLARSRLRVRQSKTDAGVRTVDIQPELHDELAAYKARSYAEPDKLVFGTSTGNPDNRNNVRRRVLVRAVARANEQIAENGRCEPLPEDLSPHALRRTFASWLVAEGEDPAYLMQQMGHTDPKMTLGLYAKALTSTRRRAHGDDPRRTDVPAPPSRSARE
jgi:integrase